LSPLAAACLALAALPAAGQAFPTKAVRMIVPFPPGGPADVMGRLFADKLATLWAQPVVIDNRAGAGGNIGSEAAARSAPDGYTILLAANSHVYNGSLYKLPYDPIRDFTPITQVVYYSLVLVVHPSVQANTLAELVALAKAQPKRLSFSNAGTGTPTHLTAELFARAAGIDIVHVPYKGAAPATTDLLAGQVQAMFNNPVSGMPHVRSGKLRLISTTGPQRALASPDVPTVAEQGYAGFEAGTWFAFMGPAQFPAEAQQRIARDMQAVLKMPDVRERLLAQGLEPIGTTPEALAAIMQAELAKWSKLIREAGIRAD